MESVKFAFASSDIAKRNIQLVFFFTSLLAYTCIIQIL